MYTIPLDLTGTAFTDRVVRDADSAVIPAHEDNIDWKDYLKWVAEGNTATVATPVLPTHVTRLQGRLALFNAGLLPQVEAAVAQAGGATAIWYSDAATWVRSDAVFVQLETALNLTSAQVDALFVAAAKIA